MEISSLPGFRELYPEDMALRRQVVEVWRDVARRYGFEEYEGPPLEPLELYVRKSGEEIVEQLYGFTDRGGREVALRPEMTPTFARMVGTRARALPKPIRWFSIPQLFRYERPQRGRLREHVQLNLDIVGEAGVEADAELLAAAIDIMRAFGFGAGEFTARVSDRELVTGLLTSRGVPPEGVPAALAALDKADRESEDRVRERLEAAGAGAGAAGELLELTRVPLEALRSELAGVETASRGAERLLRLFAALEDFGLSDFARFDGRLVRGLAYYTGPVFELWAIGEELRAICGGGRYDDLLGALGGEDLPALGFGMGDVVLGELLRESGRVPDYVAQVDDFIVFVTEGELPLARRLAHALREAGRSVGYDLAGRSVGRQFKAADQAGARRTIVLGPEERARGVAVVREMETGEEREEPLEQMLAATGRA